MIERWLAGFEDVLLSQTPETLIGALFLALLMAAAVAGSYRLLIRARPQMTEALIPIILASNLVALALGATYLRLSYPLEGQDNAHRDARSSNGDRPHSPFSFPGEGPPGPRYRGEFARNLASSILETADLDQDGELSPVEASAAAERFVREIEDLDADSLADAIRERGFHHEHESRPDPPEDDPQSRAGRQGPPLVD